MAEAKEFGLRILTQEEYLSKLKKELEENGLERSVEKRIDEIVEEARAMSYQGWSFISEQCVEILDLIRSDNDGND